MKNLDNKINNILGGLDFLAPWLIRLGLGIAFIIHGYNKFPLPPQGLINYFGFSPALATFVALSEVFAGIIIIVGGLFAFLVSWSQYILTLMIGGGRVITLPLLLFSFATSGRNDITGAIGMIYILPGIIILILTARHLSGRSAVGGFGRI